MFYYSESLSKVTTSRLEALEDPEPFFLYYHDDVFAKVDWTFEPQKSLKELYLERAQQIRNDYEYVALSYSGGADSTQVLETFYYNNIKLDEILIVGAFSQDSHSDSDENNNKEMYRNAFPLLKKLDFKDTKINVCDYTKYLDKPEEFSIINQYGSAWINEIGSYYSPHHWFWNDLWKQYRNDRKTALVFGLEKPFLKLGENKRLFFKVDDTSLTAYGALKNRDMFERVHFFTGPDTIDLMRKQFHTIKNFYRQYCVESRIMDEEFFWQHYDLVVHKLVYDLKHPIVYRSPKSLSTILSMRDQYILKNRNTTAYKIYQDGIKKLMPYTTKTQNNVTIKPFHTKYYYVE